MRFSLPKRLRPRGVPILAWMGTVGPEGDDYFATHWGSCCCCSSGQCGRLRREPADGNCDRIAKPGRSDGVAQSRTDSHRHAEPDADSFARTPASCARWAELGTAVPDYHHLL